MSTVAEAMETAGQTAILRELGADVAQGSFFAAPMSVDDTLALATAETRAVFPLVGPDDEPEGDGVRRAPSRSLVLMPTGETRASATAAPDVTGAPGHDNAGSGAGSGHQIPSFGALALDVDIDQPLPGPGIRLCLEPACWPDPLAPESTDRPVTSGSPGHRLVARSPAGRDPPTPIPLPQKPYGLSILMPHLPSAQITGPGGTTMSLVAAPWPGAMANRGSEMDSPQSLSCRLSLHAI